MKMNDFGYEDLDKVENELYDDFKKLIQQMDSVYRLDGTTTLYFVVDDVLYGYDTVTFLNHKYNVVWNEIRDYDIDETGQIHFMSKIKAMYLLEYEDVVELYSVIDIDRLLKNKNKKK